MTNKTQPALDKDARAVRQYNVNPKEMWPEAVSAWDETNVLSAGSPHFFPDEDGEPMLPFSDLSVMGELVDVDGTLTLTIEATNDEDTSAGEWHDVTASFQDDSAVLHTSIGGSITVTNGTLAFACSRSKLNYDRYRLKLVNDGDTNSVVVKDRKAAL